MRRPKSILFYRRFDRYSGGQQKVFDYFCHAYAHLAVEPSIFWADGSLDMRSTIWADHAQALSPEYYPESADAAFVAGLDWQAYLPARSRTAGQPVVNLIQHVRHADPSSDVYPFLSERAVRICVSAEVEQAILGTGRVNGPTFAIPNGIDTAAITGFRQPKQPGSVYVLGNKQPQLATELSSALVQQGLKVTCHAEHTLRDRVLRAMAQAEVCVLLPHRTEGFYLPALESMALDCLVIVPDCVGNRGFCQDGVTCLMPALSLASLLIAVGEARELLALGTANTMIERAHKRVEQHSLSRERSLFYDVLENLDAIW